MELTLDEYGPGTFPIYEGAEITGVRTQQAATLLNSLSYDERQQLADILRSGTPLEDPPDVGTPSDEDPAADDPPPVGHSTRTLQQELQAERARFLIRHGGV
jgi:hypothetical protein